MTDAPLILGVSGLRGVTGASLTPEVACRYGAVLGEWFHERSGGGRTRVVLGRDGRAGGDMVRHAAIAGLVGAGCDVVDLGVATTPTVGVMVDSEDAIGGVSLTASHNPQEWNGLKALIRNPNARGSSAAAPTPEEAAGLVDRFRGADRVGTRSWSDVGRVTREHGAAEIHAKRVIEHLPIDVVRAIQEAGYSVVLDSVNASGAEAGAWLLRLLNCRLDHHGSADSGLFPHPPEPTESHLTTLCTTVRDAHAHVGFAQDPDADRLAIIDENGRYIGEEYTLALAAMAVLSGIDAGLSPDQYTLATNLSTSRMIDDVARDFGASVVRTPVGEANVVVALRNASHAFGGEGNGGVIWPSITYVRDSLSAMALVLALKARTNKPISRLVEELNELSPSGAGYAIRKSKVDLARREDAAPTLAKVASTFAGAQVDERDGVRVDLPDRGAWVHVRASNTEPIMRLIAEAPSAGEADALIERVAALV